MKPIIIAYPVHSTALQLKNVLVENGLYVSHICATGASVLSITSEMRGGVVVCASLLRDMSAGSLAEQLGAGFDLLVLTRGGNESILDAAITLSLPLDQEEFVYAAAVLVASRSAYTQRSADEGARIDEAKRVLMRAYGLTEGQAHRQLQRRSMESGRKMSETADDIILRGN